MEKKYKIDIESQKLAKKLAKKRSLVKMQEPLADYDLKQLAGGGISFMPPEKVAPLSKGRELKPEKLEVKKANVAPMKTSEETKIEYDQYLEKELKKKIEEVNQEEYLKKIKKNKGL